MPTKRKKTACWRKQGDSAQSLLMSALSLSHLTTMSSLSELYFISYMLPEEWFGSLVSLFISGLGTPPKWKTHTISSSPMAYQFLECCPPGLDRSTKITWKLWLAPPPVHSIFMLFPFPFEFWVIRWKGGNNGKGLEATILGHSWSGVCIIQNISFYTCLQFNLLPWL